MLDGAVEADETWIRGKERNEHKSKKRQRSRGTIGKQAVRGFGSEAAKPERNRSGASKGHASKRNQGECSARLRSIYRRIEVLRRPFKDTATSSSSIQLRDMFAGQAIPTTLSPPGRYPSAAITESITG